MHKWGEQQRGKLMAAQLLTQKRTLTVPSRRHMRVPRSWLGPAIRTSGSRLRATTYALHFFFQAGTTRMQPPLLGPCVAQFVSVRLNLVFTW